MRTRDLLATAMLLSMGTSGCADVSEQDAQNDNQEQVGSATLSLTKAPGDAQCLRITVQDPARGLTKLLPLTGGQSSIFRLEGLPIGLTSFTGEAFNAPCAGVFANSVRSWYSEPVQAQVKISPAVHVVLEMIRNGRAEVAVDFDETNGPKSDPAAEELPGVTSSKPPYLVPVAPGVQIKALLTVGDAVGLKPDGVTPLSHGGHPRRSRRLRERRRHLHARGQPRDQLGRHRARARRHGRVLVRVAHPPVGQRRALGLGRDQDRVALGRGTRCLRRPRNRELQPLLLGRLAAAERVLRRRHRTRLRGAHLLQR